MVPAMPTPKVKFEATVIAGHKGVTAVVVPFDPEVVFGQPPVRLDARRDGWLIAGTANRKKLEGYIGMRWGNFFILIDPALGFSVGDSLKIAIAPVHTKKVWQRAVAQSKATTAPKKGRPDARPPP